MPETYTDPSRQGIKVDLGAFSSAATTTVNGTSSSSSGTGAVAKSGQPRRQLMQGTRMTAKALEEAAVKGDGYKVFRYMYPL